MLTLLVCVLYITPGVNRFDGNIFVMCEFIRCVLKFTVNVDQQHNL